MERSRKSWRKGLLVGGLALALQGGILGLALMIGVLGPPAPKEAKLRLPEGSPSLLRERQQAAEAQLAKLNRMQAESLQQLMEPVLDSTLAEIPVNRPPLSESFQAMGAMLPTANLFSNQTGAMMDGLDANDLPQPESVDFLGETLNAKRMVLLLDVSGSVKSKMERAGVSMEALRREVIQFVEQLGPNHLFGIIQFTRNWQVFREELVPATEAMREQAQEWINTSFRTTGTAGRNWTRGSPNGIEGVFAAAFSMDIQIDEVFLLSDGDFQRTPPGGGGQDVPWGQLREQTRRLQENSLGDTRLRVLCYYPPQDALPDLKAWVRENGNGTLRVVQ
ncbi:MAG: hypothetical protein AB3N33_06945 [Puniceicoccaceae bacterium]